MTDQNHTRKRSPGRPRFPVELKASKRIEVYVTPMDVSVLPFQTSTELNRWTRSLVHAELERLRNAELKSPVTESLG